MDYVFWGFRLILFLMGYFVAVATLYLVPTITIYPSENNLEHVYHDDKGVCYKYERHPASCT